MNFRSIVRVLSLAVFVAVAFGIAFAGGKYHLAYKFNKGEKLKYKAETNIEQTQERMGQEVVSTISADNVIDIVVEDVDKDGNISLVYKLAASRSSLRNPMMDTTFVDPPSLIGKRTRLVITSAGKRIKTEKVDTLKLSPMLAQTGGGQLASLRFPKLSKKELTVGSKWTVSEPDSQVNNNMKTYITPTSNYEVIGEADTLGYKCLKIKFSGEVKIKGKGEQMGMKIFIEGDGPTEGLLYFAPKEGRLVALKTSSEMDMTIALTGQMTMTIPSSMVTDMSMALVE